MSDKIPTFKLFFEVLFLESYAKLEKRERKAIDKAVKILSENPRHPSFNVHKAKDIKGKYPEGGGNIFIVYDSKDLRFSFEYGPEPGMIAFRNCGHHDQCERKL
ncbi:MAG: hypothetical protein JRJ85_08850 [Deltaproteobacteria bacterium]|nr:hypothetical protein [Deltaproteobacteria bacterium]